jgi:hypothetical protein
MKCGPLLKDEGLVSPQMYDRGRTGRDFFNSIARCTYTFVQPLVFINHSFINDQRMDMVFSSDAATCCVASAHCSHRAAPRAR